MSTRYSVGQMNQLGDALEAAGYSVDDVTKLRTPSVLKAIKDLWSNTVSAAVQVIAMVLALVKNFNPVTFIGAGWKVLDAETDKRAEALDTVDFAAINLDTCLKPEDNGVITGEEKLKRMKDSGVIRLGVFAFLALWLEEGHKTLEWLFKNRGVTYIDFMGTVLESPDRHRCVLCLSRRSVGGWHWGCSWLGYDWYSTDFSGSLASK